MKGLLKLALMCKFEERIGLELAKMIFVASIVLLVVTRILLIFI